MAWPKREVWLVAGQAGDTDALAAVLRARGVQVVTVLANAEPVWPEAGGQETGPTEAVCWPGVEPAWWQQAIQRGVERFSLPDFLQSLWRGDVILPVEEPYAVHAGRPLLWYFLRDAGFAPALLWPDEEKGWVVEATSVNWCWIIPAAWLTSAGGDRQIGRRSVHNEGTITAVVHPARVDYYREDLFVGFLPRRPDQNGEHAVQASVETALRLGVSWYDILSTLKSLGLSTDIPQDYLGWNQDDFRDIAGPDREELPAQPVNNLEDRRAG